MKTNVSKYKLKKRLAEGKMERLKNKHPDFDFEKALKIQIEIKKYSKAQFESFRNGFDAERCKSDDPKKLCSDCICYKSVRRIWER